MSGPFTEDPSLTPVELAPLYRKALAAHYDELGFCAVCQEYCCELWRYAYGELYRLGELVGAHTRWRDLRP